MVVSRVNHLVHGTNDEKSHQKHFLIKNKTKQCTTLKVKKQRTIKIIFPAWSKRIVEASSSEMLLFFENVFKLLYLCTYL